MRPWTRLLCLLLSVSVLLAPLANVHAHVTGEAHGHGHAQEHEHAHVSVHRGHSHEVVAHHDHHDAQAPAHDESPTHEDLGSVIDMQPDASQRGSDAFDLIQWFAISFVLVLVLYAVQWLRLKLPRRIRTRPPSPYPHALPLLRGPPHSI